MGWDISYSLAETPSEFFDFTVMSAQDPLSADGAWSNNTQGTGGNVAPTTGTSLRIATKTGGGLACIGSAAAQANYEDSFAFLPGVSGGNMRVIATVFVADGYDPEDNHEIQIILGCKTSLAYHRWIECLWALHGGQQTLSQDGDFNGAAFTNIGTSTGLLAGGPQNGDKMIAELYLSANRVRWGRIQDGVTTWAQDTTDELIDETLGNGAGLAVFRRSIAPDSVAASLGFTDFLVEAF